MRDDSVEILFKSFVQEAIVSSSGTGRDVHSLTLSIQLTMALPTLKGALKNGFGEAAVAWDMPEPYKFPSPAEVLVDPQGSCSCSAPSRLSCAPIRRYGEVSSYTSFRKPGPFLQSQQEGSMFHSRRGGWK